jgi:hypothetical protein
VPTLREGRGEETWISKLATPAGGEGKEAHGREGEGDADAVVGEVVGFIAFKIFVALCGWGWGTGLGAIVVRVTPLGRARVGIPLVGAVDYTGGPG